ncbi:KIR protein [Plasmodium coatneyi]|uniref:KIR protein n=1 Tax=Plasmodium coatneyi TaxID=208452 RepID=A0A1B1DT99_9APIC|nr:KIR protein [Plasmodium coatneyi]ANQ05869.1 KIR protein [Plasmodium coatneyi]
MKYFVKGRNNVIEDYAHRMVNVGADATLTQEELEKLSSYTNFYSKFKDGCVDCGDESEQKFMGALVGCDEIEHYKGKIAKALCCIADMKKRTESRLYHIGCNFFYYWMTNIIISGQHSGKLKDITKIVLPKLKELYKGSNCEILDKDTTDTNTLKKRKTIFDYYIECEIIGMLALRNQSQCTEKYGKYLEGIVAIYEEVKKECQGRLGNDEYCKGIKDVFEDKCDPKKLKAKCTALSKPGSASSQDSLGPRPEPGSGPGTTSNGGTFAIPAASSILGIVGLPSIIFLLYKYTSIFSGIRGTLSGGNNSRKREGRSTIGHELNTSEDENDDFISYATTTVGSSSNLSTDHSTDQSTIYDISPKRGTRAGRAGTNMTNNNKPGHHQRKKSQQQQRQSQQKSRNIAYQNM